MKKFFKSLLKGFLITIIGGIAFIWVVSFLFPRAYNVIEGKVLGIESDSVITVVQNHDTLAVAKPKVVKQVKEFDYAVKLENKHGCYYIPTIVNGIPMKMMLDTGASSLVISVVEYEFMKKQGLLKDNKVEVANATIANGEKVKCYSTKIDEITIGDASIKDVECTVMPQQDAPLLLGMSVLKKFGNISIDYERNLLILR